MHRAKYFWSLLGFRDCLLTVYLQQRTWHCSKFDIDKSTYHAPMRSWAYRMTITREDKKQALDRLKACGVSNMDYQKLAALVTDGDATIVDMILLRDESDLLEACTRKLRELSTVGAHHKFHLRPCSIHCNQQSEIERVDLMPCSLFLSPFCI